MSTYVKLATKSAMDAKVVACGNEAWGACCRMIAWSGEHLTDGLIPDQMALLFAGSEDVLETLVCHGLVTRDSRGTQLVAFRKWNTSRADVEKKRDAARARQRRKRAKPQSPSRCDTAVTHAPVTQPEDRRQKTEIEDVSVASPPRKVSPDVKRVFEAWKHDTGHHRAKLDAKRSARIKARLADFSPEQLIIAISHRHHDPFLMGQNDTGKVYDGIETLLRDVAKVEELIALDEPLRPNGRRTAPNRAQDRMDHALAAVREAAAEEHTGLPPAGPVGFLEMGK